MPQLAFLHTSPVHIPTFEQLLNELAPGLSARHIVDEGLLTAARAEGVTAALITQVGKRLREATEDGATVVLCTCSTIGGVAEQVAEQAGQTVFRVDRAMAAQAVALGPRILVVAALESTLEPTAMLIQDEARIADRTVELILSPCPEAWPAFEAGDHVGYLARIAAHVRAEAEKADVVVLAQASMAGAAALLADIAMPVLASPRLGLAAALAAIEPNTLP